MKTKKRIVLIIVTSLLLVSFIIGGMFAYLTDTDEVTNKFTVGKVSIDLIEPSFSGIQTGIIPNQEINKDPKITNDGQNDAIVFLKITVPIKNVATANLDGTLTEEKINGLPTKKTQELFTMNGNPGVSGNSQHKFNLSDNGTSSGWIELTGKEQTSTDGTTWNDFTAYPEIGKYYYDDGTIHRTYVFGYNTILKPNETTPTIFDTVTFLNIIEGQIPSGTELNINIDAYAIQANYIENIDTTSNTLSNNTLSRIYDVYVKQNS
ncbi:MAG: TasA family protein [Oscillospiraceae bacterium]